MSGRKIEEQKYSTPTKRGSKSKGTSTPADWGTADPKLLLRAIELVTKAGGALRFGYTRDGGAYAIGVYENGNCETEYLKPDESLDDWLQGIIRDFED